jgi:hypothetical protein
MTLAERRLLAREALLSAALAGTLAALLLWTTPPGIDWAAHAYQRTFLLQHGFAIWNNFWYAGRYSFVTYSLLYYPLAALFGIRVLALASIASAAAAFSVVFARQWGPASRFSSRSFAVVWVGIIGAAAFPFALAVSFALLGLWALQDGRRGRFALCAVLTLAASPLAFAFLGVVLVAVVWSRRSLRGVRVEIAAIAVCVVAEFVLIRLFGEGGTFPFGLMQLLPSLGFCAVGIVLTRGVPTARVLFAFFWIYLATCLTAYIVPSAIGSNIERMRYAAIPLALIVVALRGWRPLWAVVPVVALAVVWNVTPIATSMARANTDPESSKAYWQPAIGYLKNHLSPSYRVEVVDTAEHWPAAYFPDAGIPIVRGWYRQSDFPQNQVLYDPTLGPRTYDHWLRQMGVRYVVISDAPVDYSSRNEAALIRSGRSGLIPVARLPHLVVYELPDATPLITGPGSATVVWLWSQRLVAQIDAPGTYDVRIRWSPYWRPSTGCVSESKDGMTRLTTHETGLIQLAFAVNVKSSLQTLAGDTPKQVCASRDR